MAKSDQDSTPSEHRENAPLDEDGMTEEGPFPAPCPTCGRRWFHIEGCSDGH